MAKKEFETARYFELAGEKIYTISYCREAPSAWVLLCGPFPSDRLFSLAAWAKWARYLMKDDIAAVRFDYSGTGESTGDFFKMDFGRWLRDIEGMCDWVSPHTSDLPLILHGLGMGALLAQKAFAAGRGDGLLMWSPPLHALEILKQGLMARLSLDMLHRVPCRKSGKDYIQDLKSGRPVMIDGYTWSGALWSSGEDLALDRAYTAPGEGIEEKSGRPWQHVILTDRQAPLIKTHNMLRVINPGRAVLPATLDQDFSDFFEQNASWIRRSAQSQVIIKRNA